MNRRVELSIFQPFSLLVLPSVNQFIIDSSTRPLQECAHLNNNISNPPIAAIDRKRRRTLKEAQRYFIPTTTSPSCCSLFISTYGTQTNNSYILLLSVFSNLLQFAHFCALLDGTKDLDTRDNRYITACVLSYKDSQTVYCPELYNL